MKVRACVGKTIASAELLKWVRGGPLHCDTLVLKFSDGWKLEIWDGGQDCCEARYITCDDDLNDLKGARWFDIEERPLPDLFGEYGDVHEMMFVAIQTDKGGIVLNTHNEHNGYYGGFSVTLRAVAPPPVPMTLKD